MELDIPHLLSWLGSREKIAMKAGFCEGEDNVLGPTMSPSPSLGRVKKFGLVLHGENPGTVWTEGREEVKVHVCDVLYCPA